MNLNGYSAQCHEDNYKWWLDLSKPCDRCRGTGSVKEIGGYTLRECSECMGTGYAYNPNRNVGEMLMLCVSELAEAMESHRKGNRADDKLPHRSGFEVELADCLIRIFDLARAKGLDLEGAYQEKRLYNLQREDHSLKHRMGEGGKQY